ncbi:NdufA6 NADH-ubiquinone oxidoreductase 14.8 kDa subunit [Neolentinus lepideus HHB14362 ss-1]|uniref:NdufA6 NADH-ubiquinone oxidoreductase 14.8 kDa subunit n=1 Tax=Neolentinus lepideus HHB14362 ss-1 TaxID=1314782 RepID=A0A165QWY4_9AGAM|nr:NdufA6 NADH-ubiquinone oxidoreductase 14.8 kDa subunit [Neolentinus lepideus HHB14362 ss-1]
MTTIPTRLAQAVRTSKSPVEARKRAIQLYRDWYRAAPEVVTLYALSIHPSQIRHAVRAQFERNRHVTDHKVIDVLLLKGRQEYQETLNCWKQNDHILGILLEEKSRPQRTFLEKFYEGRDEDAVLPATGTKATGLIGL